MKNKKGFYRYIGRKTEANESVPSLINQKGELATVDMEKADICWKHGLLSSRQSRLLECIKDNFLTQEIDSCTWGGAMLWTC